MALPLWAYEVAVVPEAIIDGILGTWSGAPKVSVSIPPPSKPGLPDRPTPRWRRDVRRVTGLSLSSCVKEIPFQCIHFQPIDGANKSSYCQLVIDGIRWRGAWAMEVNMDHGHMQTFQTFGDPFPKAVPVGPSKLVLVATNFEAPHQVVTFQLNGPWSIGELVGGGYTFTLGNAKSPLEMKVK